VAEIDDDLLDRMEKALEAHDKEKEALKEELRSYKDKDEPIGLQRLIKVKRKTGYPHEDH